jgi:Tfp pilus assembly protein PilF
MSVNTNKIRTLAAYVKNNPEDSFSKFALALELMKQNEVSKSRVLFESILKQDPEYLGVYYHLGKLYEQIGLPGEAESLYKKGIDLARQQENSRTETELKDALELLTF